MCKDLKGRGLNRASYKGDLLAKGFTQPCNFYEMEGGNSQTKGFTKAWIFKDGDLIRIYHCWLKIFPGHGFAKHDFLGEMVTMGSNLK